MQLPVLIACFLFSAPCTYCHTNENWSFAGFSVLSSSCSHGLLGIVANSFSTEHCRFGDRCTFGDLEHWASHVFVGTGHSCVWRFAWVSTLKSLPSQVRVQCTVRTQVAPELLYLSAKINEHRLLGDYASTAERYIQKFQLLVFGSCLSSTQDAYTFCFSWLGVRISICCNRWFWSDAAAPSFC